MDKPIAFTSCAPVEDGAMAALSRAHWTFTTRRVARRDAVGLSDAVAAARSGDLVLCEITEIGQHRLAGLGERLDGEGEVGIDTAHHADPRHRGNATLGE